MEFIESTQFAELLKQRTPILDVRAPIEFAAGHVPGSINLPILTDAERHEIGTIYKEQGQSAAITRGQQLVSGAVKAERVAAWAALAQSKANLVLTCFRGGMRSGLAQQWLAEASVLRPRIQGGYKALRTFMMSKMQSLSARPMLIVSGATGAGKTLALQHAARFRPALDLEFIARHRGSAFGAYLEPQPAQANFENELTREMLTFSEGQALVVEDESRMIGKLTLPEIFFKTMRQSPVVIIDEPLESRVELTFNVYVGDVAINDRARVFASYAQALQNISRRLGGVLFQEVVADFERARANVTEPALHRVWIEKLLHSYYDPLYLNSLAKRDPVISFRGSRVEVVEYLRSVAE